MKTKFPFLDAPPLLRRRMLELAREFRKEPTRSEDILWQALRGKKLDGVKFRRQQPIGPMIVDFYNSNYRLIIEVDGLIHDFQKEADRDRQVLLQTLGFNVLRVKSELIESDLSAALEIIHTEIRNLKSQSKEFPPPSMGEGAGGG